MTAAKAGNGILAAHHAAEIARGEGIPGTHGFDDIYPSSLFDPPITTVHQPMRMLGERSCARLLERIANPGLRPATELLPTELVLRSSCGCPPGAVVREPVPTLKVPRSELTAAAPSHSPRPSPQPGRRPARQAAKA